MVSKRYQINFNLKLKALPVIFRPVELLVFIAKLSTENMCLTFGFYLFLIKLHARLYVESVLNIYKLQSPAF